MKLGVVLFVRRLYGEQVLVRLAAEPETCVFAPSLQEALLDLELLLVDRLERTHPRLLHRLASPDNAELASYVLPKALPVHGPDALERRPMRVTCFVSRHKEYERLWFPSWDLRHWVAARTDVAEQAASFLGEYLPRLGARDLLARRIERKEELHTLELEVGPPPLAAFTGIYLGRDLLPEPAQREDEEERERARKARGPATPTLDRVAIDLTDRARHRELGRAIRLDALVDRLERELETEGSALVLVGSPGLGKTMAIYELAHRLAARLGGTARERSKERGRRLWHADATRLIALRGILDDWRSQTLGVIDEVALTGDVWYLGSILALLDAGKSIESEENVAQILRPHLARRRLRAIGEATVQEWARLEARDPGFARTFTPIRIDEPAAQESLAILRDLAALHASRRAPAAGEDALRSAMEVGARYGGHQSAHAASLALLMRALEAAQAEEPLPSVLDRNGIVSVFCRESGMPEVLVRDDLPLDASAIRARLGARIVGQPEAVSRMVDLVGMLKAGLADPSRPLGSFLFVGPTGVGKTETAKALAETLYGSDQRLVRFDMSELATGDAVSRFVGRGGEPGKLVTEIRRMPFCVLLLDEIEKAHPVAFDALLQVLGEARLSDEAGRTASFRNVVVIMTSNLGAETLRPGVGFGEGGTAGWSEHFVREARRFFRPELFNRIDHVVAFAALPAEAIAGIAERELRRLGRREGLCSRGVRLEVSSEARALLVERGTDLRYGARPLKRAIERELAGPIARHLSGSRSVDPGAIEADAGGGGIVLAFNRDRAGDGAGEQALRETVDAVGELRWFVDRCGLSSVLRELRLEAARVERLLANPTYLRGFESLRSQLATVGPDQELLARFESLRAHAESLEDLAYEMASARDTSANASLMREHGEVVESIKDVGLRLAARRHERPNVAVLLMHARSAAYELWRALFTLYGSLALRRGWRIATFVARDEAPMKLETDERTVKIFQEIANELGPEGNLRKFVDTLCVPVMQSDQVIALRFEGPFCAPLLAAEHGAHEQHERGKTSRSRPFGRASTSSPSSACT